MTKLVELESQIRLNRLKLDLWLQDQYAGHASVTYSGEVDASYPDWGEIERLAGTIFDERLVSKLSSASVQSLLFFISRSDEVGAIIAWLKPHNGALSAVGDLTHDDFLFLCKMALEAKDDYCDYQLINCFQKLPALDQKEVELLKQFFNSKQDSYSRRLVIHALSKFEHRETVFLVRELWNSDTCEFAKLSCMYSLQSFPEAKSILVEYLADYERCFPQSEDYDYRKIHIERLRACLGH